MARKLKSDKVLFITTILLVGLSVVMVYSASAPMALDRYGRATRFLTTQLMWAVLGIAMLTLVMRIDYRHYRKPTFIWTGLALRLGEMVNDRALNLDLFQGFEESVVDLYSAVRHGYLRRREQLIKE